MNQKSTPNILATEIKEALTSEIKQSKDEIFNKLKEPFQIRKIIHTNGIEGAK